VRSPLGGGAEAEHLAATGRRTAATAVSETAQLCPTPAASLAFNLQGIAHQNVVPAHVVERGSFPALVVGGPEMAQRLFRIMQGVGLIRSAPGR
jgi:hypothetical protein